MTHAPVLVVGVPRSGSSWVGRVLGSTPGSAYLNEPDNHQHSPFALRAKLGLPGRFYTELTGDDDAAAYSALWTTAFAAEDSGDSPMDRVRRNVSSRLLRRATDAEVRRAFAVGRCTSGGLRMAAALAVPERPPAGDRLVVKSVHAQLSLEWLAARFPIRIAIVLRDPLNVLSSWKQMGWLRPGAEILEELDPETARRLEARYAVDACGTGTVEQAAHLIGLLHSALTDVTSRHADWVVLSHEELCARPHEGFQEAAESLGLRWGDAVDALVDDLNRPGRGYETARVTAGLADAWRSRLTAEEQDAARTVFGRFERMATG
jgi:hypothetical protein